MAVEPHDGSSLPDILVPANPPSDDPVAQGDDHLRLLKIVVQNFYTAYLAELLAAQTRLTTLETLTASGSVGDANKLGGQLPAFYRDASNLNAGTVPSARLVGTYAISISGNAATANSATHAADASTADYATSAGDSALLAGQTVAQLFANNFRASVASGTFTDLFTVTLPPLSPLRLVRITHLLNVYAPPLPLPKAYWMPNNVEIPVMWTDVGYNIEHGYRYLCTGGLFEVPVGATSIKYTIGTYTSQPYKMLLEGV